MTDLSKSLFTRINKDNRLTLKAGDINLPKTVYVSNFNNDATRKFLTDMSEAEVDNDEIIPIIIDSYGGEVYSLMAMVDCIKSSSKKIATISLGKSMSCGALLFSCGTNGYRFIAPSSTIMIHDVSTGSSGKVNEIRADADESQRLDSFVYNLLDVNCGKPAGYFKNLVHKKGHADWFLGAKECKKHGLANHIKIPRFEIEVSMKIDLV